MGLLAILAHKGMGVEEHPNNYINVHMVNMGTTFKLGQIKLVSLIKCLLQQTLLSQTPLFLDPELVDSL